MIDPHVDRCEHALRILATTRAAKDVHGECFLDCGRAISEIAAHLAAYVKQRGGERMAAIDKMLADQRNQEQ